MKHGILLKVSGDYALFSRPEMKFYAHTLDGKSQEYWEPLFTPFGVLEDECQRESCQKCEHLEPHHGHLNKVAFWTAKFAAEMFLANSEESKSAHPWGYLTGLSHDLSKFEPEWQERAPTSRSFEAAMTPPHRSIQFLDRSLKRFFQMHPLIARIRKTIQYRNHLLVQTAPVLPRPLLQCRMQILR